MALVLSSLKECDSPAAALIEGHFFDLVAQGNLQEVQRFTSGGADVNARTDKRETPLMLAAAVNRNTDVIEFLIKHGADVHAWQDWPGKRGDGKESRWTALKYAAAFNSNERVARVLINAGAKVDAQSESGMTPLMLAVKNPAVITVLLEEGAEVNMPDLGGVTPLMEAAKVSSPQVIKTLLKAGADASIRSKRGQTASDYAKRNPNLRGTTIFDA